MKKTFLFFSAILIFACTDDEGNPCVYEPTLTTQAVTDITETSATLNGVISIVSENCDVPNNTEQGFVYSTEIQPTLEDIQVNVNGTNISTTIEGLEPNTTYYVRAFLTNNFGDFYSNEVSFSTEELDLTPPVITIIGDNPLEINIGEDYTEFGATATDDIDGDITQDIIIDSSNVNTALAGNYTVTYSVSDLSNNSTSEQREVIVIDNSLLLNCDGNPVPTIVYGTQEWTVENACHITYRDGTPIPQVTDNEEWANLTIGAWSYYNNDPSKEKLYNGLALLGIFDEESLLDESLRKKFEPEGWHIPSDEEWTSFEEYIIANGYNYDGTTTGNKIVKALSSTVGWNYMYNLGSPGNDQSANNSTGFNAIPSGYRVSDGTFDGENYTTVFVSSTTTTPQSVIVWNRTISHIESLTRSGFEWELGRSVRLVKD